jgi:hypothetical protein
MSQEHHRVLCKIGVLTPEGLVPVFRRFFTTIMKREDVLHFMDIFLVDGSKAMYRLALSFLQLVPKSKLQVSFTMSCSLKWLWYMTFLFTPSL